ncbi:MAG: histidine phosphatase family protein [Lachnoclostridium edouardi]|uniref:histidine phosphatase family protein n=1 Tax=Lachnoclostridium edouardi TaxID=1926283 RepID=UPI0026DD0897|nr:histidine phosphatase family protein [Lachnoclostridium edouardi]MDO4278879.1 histidine phosphatase family protein [Lachnoclostridium edouardi]
MKIYLIRHGQTDWNLAGRIQGSHDISLNETGRRQAEYLARGMKKRPVVQIFSSKKKRAMETANAIGASQGVKVIPLDGLEEVEFGLWEGMTWKEIQEKYPEEYKIWQKEPAEITPPGGESRQQVYERVGKAADKIVKRAEGDVAVVSHGAALAYMLSYMMRKSLGSHEEIIVENVSISTVEYDKDTGMYTLIELNDTSHLPG